MWQDFEGGIYWDDLPESLATFRIIQSVVRFRGNTVLHDNFIVCMAFGIHCIIIHYTT